jgi:hypothetical protein
MANQQPISESQTAEDVGKLADRLFKEVLLTTASQPAESGGISSTSQSLSFLPYKIHHFALSNNVYSFDSLDYPQIYLSTKEKPFMTP